MWNLSTDVRPPKLSKLTIRKFHIFQKWPFGTNSSHGVNFAKREIRSSTKLRHGVGVQVQIFDFFVVLLINLFYRVEMVSVQVFLG